MFVSFVVVFKTLTLTLTLFARPEINLQSFQTVLLLFLYDDAVFSTIQEIVDGPVNANAIALAVRQLSDQQLALTFAYALTGP